MNDSAVRFFYEGDDFFWSLREALTQARETIDIELYYFASDAVGWGFAPLLKERAALGIRVRLLYDSVGCRETSDDLFEDLRRGGVHVREFHPLFSPPVRHWGRRNHRKMILVDRQVSFSGGYNIAAEYSRWCSQERAWRDTGIRIEDDEIAGDLQRLFNGDWEGRALSRREFFRQGRRGRPNWTRAAFHVVPNFGWKRMALIRQEYLSAIIHAKKSIHLTNPYFVPDRGFRRALRRAAKRGVDVRVLTAGVSDVRIVQWASRSIYGSLLRAGIKIFEYQGRVLHAKSAVIDQEWFTVGTSNLDPLSFFNNLEVNLFARSPPLAGELSRQFFLDLESSKGITLEEWSGRSWWMRLKERFFFYFRFWL